LISTGSRVYAIGSDVLLVRKASTCPGIRTDDSLRQELKALTVVGRAGDTGGATKQGRAATTRRLINPSVVKVSTLPIGERGITAFEGNRAREGEGLTTIVGSHKKTLLADYYILTIRRDSDFELPIAGLEGAKNRAGRGVLRLIQIRLRTPSLEGITPACQAKKSSTLVAAVSVRNPDCLPVRIDG